MARWCAERTTQEAVDTLGRGDDSGRPGAEPATGAGASAHPRRRLHAGRRLSGPAKTCADRARAAVRLSETPGEIVTRPPTLGEHTDRVLADHRRYDADAIAALRNNGII